jgi:hypothetical protein
MAREPALLVAAVGGKPNARQVIWDAIRRLRRFTRLELADAIKRDGHGLSIYLTALARAGHLAVTEKPGGRKARVYELVRDVGVEAPRLCANGTPSTKGLLLEQTWRTIRMLDQFTPRELAICASTETHQVSEDYAQNYVSWLFVAGYLTRIVMDAPGRPATYRAVKSRYSGPRAPRVVKLQSVFDPNLGKIVWHEDPDE